MKLSEKESLFYLELGQKAARAAGTYLTNGISRGVLSCSGHDIKLSADRESEEIILDILREDGSFPVLSEEAGMGVKGNRESDFIWIVDPLDGSFNYYRELPFHCVSIALWDGNRPWLGIVYDFTHGEMFYGVGEDSACLNGKRIKVSSLARRADAVLCTGFPVKANYTPAELAQWNTSFYCFKKARLLGSAGLSLAYIAAGRMDAYFEEGIMLWDVAGGLAILAAAGGKYVMAPYKEEPYCFVVKATNGLFDVPERNDLAL